MSGRNSETNITKSILLAVGGVGGPGMAWQQTVGKFRSLGARGHHPRNGRQGRGCGCRH